MIPLYRVVNMKKIIASVLCLTLIFSAFAVPVSASDGNGTESISIVDEIEKFFGNLTILFTKYFNGFFGKDEADIPFAEPKAPSWQEYTDDDFVTNPEQTVNAETWVATELTFESEKAYSNAFNDVQLDILLYGNGRLYTVPGFWNGGNEWNVRFVCPEAGEWYYKTVCSDKENTSLDGRTGKVICSQYSGDLEIYKHGFISADSGKKYLTYADGTQEIIEEKILLAAVCNGKCYGGGFKLAPDADLSDGILNVEIIRDISRSKFISMVADYKKGTHIDTEKGELKERFKEIVYYKKCVAVKIEGVKSVCADGELFEESTVEVKVIPHAINYLID